MHFALFSSACTVFSEVDMTCNNITLVANGTCGCVFLWFRFFSVLISKWQVSMDINHINKSFLRFSIFECLSIAVLGFYLGVAFLDHTVVLLSLYFLRQLHTVSHNGCTEPWLFLFLTFPMYPTLKYALWIFKHIIKLEILLYVYVFFCLSICTPLHFNILFPW